MKKATVNELVFQVSSGFALGTFFPDFTFLMFIGVLAVLLFFDFLANRINKISLRSLMIMDFVYIAGLILGSLVNPGVNSFLFATAFWGAALTFVYVAIKDFSNFTEKDVS